MSSHPVVMRAFSSSQFFHAKLRSTVVSGVALGLSLIALGCGSSGGSFVPVKGPFSKSSVNGSYTYILYGLDINGPFSEAGVFTADGNGHVTGGIDDFNQGGNFASNAITGTYTLTPDGSGQITFTLTNVAPPNTFQFTFALVNTRQMYITEADSFANGSGFADLQTPSAVSATPSGTFAFRVHAFQSANGPVGTIGQVVSTAGAVQGIADILRAGTLSAVNLTGSLGAPDANGRGTFTYTDSATNASTNYAYYIIDANTVRLLGTDGAVLSEGRLEAQSGGPFSNSSLAGSYAFGTVGNLLNGNNDGGLSRTVGSFSASGGAISGGGLDATVNGTVLSNTAVESGSYTVSSSGETALTLNISGGAPIQEMLWLVNPSRAFILVSDATKIEDGAADLQHGTFGNNSLNQQAAMFMEGITTSNYLTRVGTFIPDGNGNVTLNEVANAFTSATGATLNAVSLSGNYTVGSGGRVTGTFASSPNIDFVMYLVAPNQGYILQSDSGTQLSGQVTLQTSP